MSIAAINRDRFIGGAHTELGPFDAVAFQDWLQFNAEDFSALQAAIHVKSPAAQLIYLDWYAPLDLRRGELLDAEIKAYVKKQTFADRDQYNRPTQGDTNLTDYYGRAAGLEEPVKTFNVPPTLFDKLIIGPGFCTSPSMIEAFHQPFAPKSDQHLDLHARIAVKGTPWYSHMRATAAGAVGELDGIKTAVGTGIDRRAYMRELRDAKLCFSPFGYGEVCWRDYEAAQVGSLLLKPDMSHVVTNPDIFRADETYVPLQWDYSDLNDKVKYYLANPAERRRITSNAFEVIHRYFEDKAFLQHFERLWQLVNS